MRLPRTGRAHEDAEVFPLSPDIAARLFALEINNQFIKKPEISKDDMADLIDVFKMLACKDVFASYHAYLLGKRVLLMKEHTMNHDQEFIGYLKDLCGPEYVKSFKSVFEDLNSSLQIMKELRKKNEIPPWLSCVLFSNETWPGIEPSPAAFPKIVQPYLQLFEKSVKKGHKVQHSLQLTRVKLEVKGVKGIKVIKCNGFYAVYLLAFNEIPSLTQPQLAKFTKLDVKQVEEITENLKRKKSGSLIILVHQLLRVNPDAELPNEEL